MYLKSLELSGFKSFSKKADLIFKTPITSIVGPNGSGKSNVAEAFRFVLGEQSFKSMRGKKGEDLIWNGSDAAPRANRASVKIVFDNAKRFLNLDFDEVSVERTVFRDGVNEYSINGSRVRLRDVFELLAGAHIGASGHHIISQGEADRILNSSTKDRKVMIEDALGLKIYQYKKEESERKLEKTEENIKSVESLRREVLPHLKFLKKQVEKVEKAFEMRGKLGSLYKEYLKREEIYLAQVRAGIAAEKAPVEKHLAELERELKQAKETLERSSTHDQKSQNILDLEEKIRRVREKKDSIILEAGRIEGQIAAEERMVKKEAEAAKASAVSVPLSEIENFADELEQSLKRADEETDITGLRKIMLSIQSNISGFLTRYRHKTNESSLADSEKVLELFRSKRAEYEKKISELSADEQKFSREYSDLRREIDAEKDTNRAAEKKVFEVMTAQNQALAEKGALRVREEALDLEEADFKRERGEAAAMLGRELVDLSNFEIKDEDGQKILAENVIATVMNEVRSVQHDRRRDIEKIKIRLEESGVGSADDIMKEYKEVSERDAFLIRELEDLEKSAESLRKLIVEFSEKINTEFASGLEKINQKFEEFFALMFGGGTAKLVLQREKKRRSAAASLLDAGLAGLGAEGLSDEFSATASMGGQLGGELGDSDEEVEVEEGIDISVNLPRKKIKGLMMLSGGERALTSIALIFAMSQVKPPPFIILDETDAALDEANSRKYGDMIENLAKYSQLILITHNRETMSRAGVLYGVTMMSGTSKLLSIQFDEAVAVAK